MTGSREEVSEAEKEAGSNKLNKPLGIDVSKQEGGSKEPEENEPKQEPGVNEPTQEVEVSEVKHEVESTVPEHDRCMEKSGSGRSVESSKALHEPLPDRNPPPPTGPTPPPPTGPTPQPTPPPKECPPVLPTAPEPLSAPTKEDDYSTVADALALVEGERVLVCKRPSVAVTSPCATQLPSQFRAPTSDDYCEVIFANNNEQTLPHLEGEAQGGQGVKRVRTLPRQVRQDKEEVVRVKERSFSLRGKPAHPQGRRPLDLPLPHPQRRFKRRHFRRGCIMATLLRMLPHQQKDPSILAAPQVGMVRPSTLWRKTLQTVTSNPHQSFP